MTPPATPKVMAVCSPGGHLLQLLQIAPAWDGAREVWVTLDGADVQHLLRDRDVRIGHGPTNRSLTMLLRNLSFAWRTLRAERPDVIVSTGAGLAPPFFLIGRLLGARLVYVESLTRITGLSASGRMVRPLAHAVFVQWPDLATGSRRFAGRVL